MATWPFELDGLGEAFKGQVVEVGGSAYRNRFRPDRPGAAWSGSPGPRDRIRGRAPSSTHPEGRRAAGTGNRFRPEATFGSSTALGNSFDDERVGVHAMLYPQPFGLQGEWNWGSPSPSSSNGQVAIMTVIRSLLPSTRLMVWPL
jgi:hypothetical protein